MSDAQKRFEDLLQFPTEFTFRVVVHAGEAVREACLACLSARLGRSATRVDVQPSRQGNYQVLRLTVSVLSATEIRDMYAALDAIEGVRMVL